VIPSASITAWRKAAPWGDNTQIEQDLVLSRALVELFSRPVFAKNAAFRGGTALHKLFFDPPGRYSEDIDLVQRTAGPIGPLVAEIRSVLDPWLGKPKWKAGQRRFTLTYRFDTTFTPVVRMRVKIEINTREHFVVHGFTSRRIVVDNPWFSGEVDVVTYTLPELLGTKLRALYQRKKGRDLFDLALALEHTDFDPAKLVEAFEQYMTFGGTPVTRAQFEANMAAKISDPPFLNDVPSLLRTGLAYEPSEAWSRVHANIVTRLPGNPWQGDTDAS
jgi:predicted nucleotidyltransferase component of viral defense system